MKIPLQVCSVLTSLHPKRHPIVSFIMNPEAISTLIESNRYNTDILPQLENYVQYQVEKGTYHLEANLAVLKFYQFHPEKANKFLIGSILIKALMNLPNTDFLMCSYLVPEKLVSFL